MIKRKFPSFTHVKDCSEILPCSISWKGRQTMSSLLHPSVAPHPQRLASPCITWIDLRFLLPKAVFSSSLSTRGCTSQLKYWHLNPFFRLISQAPKLCCLTDLLQFLLVHSLILKFWPNLMLMLHVYLVGIFQWTSILPKRHFLLFSYLTAWTVSLSNYINNWFNHY